MILTLLGLSINVASAGNGSVGIGYASDYFREGSLVSAEALQASASYGLKAGGLDVGVGAFTNQPIDGGVDTYLIDATISKALNDTFSASLGLEHAEFVAGVATLDVTASVSLNTILNPSLTIKRDTEDELYVFEVAASHDIDLDIATLSLGALYGNTDVTTSSNIDYYSLGANLSRSLGENSTLNASLDYVDSDSIDNESIFGLGITVRF
tara:strand:- start:7994 stop:8626 length:633 start_codon:yes stop_codon:yes gene_type:complete